MHIKLKKWVIENTHKQGKRLYNTLKDVMFAIKFHEYLNKFAVGCWSINVF